MSHQGAKRFSKEPKVDSNPYEEQALSEFKNSCMRTKLEWQES
jgi:hypothetical protein